MPKTQFPAQIELSSLNGQNGFILNGESQCGSSCHQAGYSVSQAGKSISGYGYADFLIGAPFMETVVLFIACIWAHTQC